MTTRVPVSIVVAGIWIAPAVFATVGHIGHAKLAGEPLPPLGQLAGGSRGTAAALSLLVHREREWSSRRFRV